MNNIFKKIILGVLLLFLILVGFFTVGQPSQPEKITWGISFSQKHAQNLGLDWKETYLAILEDLEVKNLRLAVHWDLIEPEQGKYNFEDLDWQLKKAEERGAKVILIIGMKTGRWPECHEPQWVRDQAKIKEQKLLLEYIEKIVNRYKDNKTIWAWQVENEPLFPFGECPWKDEKFLKEEKALVKSLDSQRPIIINSSGEWSFWWKEARIGDIVGTSLYRIIWTKELGIYVNYFFFTPTYFWRKTQIIKQFFGKNVICVELQAEPWGPTLLYDSPLEEQKKTMNLKQFQKNIAFAKKTGLKEFYLWGVEWWYWLKTKQNDSSIWNEAQKLFS